MDSYRFCPKCGDTLRSERRGGKSRPVCRECGFVLYRNPAVGVAVILREGDRVLLGRRSAGRDRGGQWCIPCGYVEWGEEVRAAARREFQEETGLDVEVGAVFAVQSNFHNPDALTVGIWFEGRVVGGDLKAGDDLEAVGYFPLDQLPEPLAFPTDVQVLKQLREADGERRRS